MPASLFYSHEMLHLLTLLLSPLSWVRCGETHFSGIYSIKRSSQIMTPTDAKFDPIFAVKTAQYFDIFSSCYFSWQNMIFE